MSAVDDHWIERIKALGAATDEQLEEARGIRQQLLDMGMRSRTIPEILHEKGWIDDEMLKTLKREARRHEGKEQIAGYRLIERLGEGAMGTVYKARQLSLDRDVAIKVLAPDLARDDSYVERFMTEARAVARLNHTNIISGIDVGDADGIKYLVMEFADGMTVDQLLKRGGSLDEERALAIVLQIARALDHAHRSQLIHRDVKPDNVIITKDGVAKLVDLGLAKIQEGEGDGQRMGTPAYMSPELARGESQVDERTDLYSLGATLFHLLTGRPPFEGDDPTTVMSAHLTDDAPSVRQVDPTISAETAELVSKMLMKARRERIQTAKDLIGLLEQRMDSLKAARAGAAPAARGSAPAPRGAAPAAPSAAPPAPGGGVAAPTPRRRRRRR